MHLFYSFPLRVIWNSLSEVASPVNSRLTSSASIQLFLPRPVVATTASRYQHPYSATTTNPLNMKIKLPKFHRTQCERWTASVSWWISGTNRGSLYVVMGDLTQSSAAERVRPLLPCEKRRRKKHQQRKTQRKNTTAHATVCCHFPPCGRRRFILFLLLQRAQANEPNDVITH